MILRSITVSNWRCFLSTVTVGPFIEGLNVLHAPNATGKSTLFEALLRALLDGHSTGGEKVKTIRPWGRSLSPFVVVDFCHKGIEYRITKQFLDRSRSLLERKENGRFVSWLEADDADEEVRKIVSRSVTKSSSTQFKNWGLAQVLWAPQGNLAFGGLSGDVMDDIRSSLGAQVSVSASGPMEKQLNELYSRIYTSGGKLRSGKDAPELVRLEGNLDEARGKYSNAVRQQQAFTESVRRIEDLRADRAQSKRDEENISKELKESQSRENDYKGLISQQKQREARLNETKAQYDKLNQHIGLIKSSREEQQKSEEALHILERDMPLQEKEFIEREKAAAAAKAELEDVRKGRQVIDKAQEEAEQSRRFVDASNEGEEMKERLGKIADARKTFEMCCGKRDEVVSPDGKALEEIRRAIKERDDANFRVSASLITLEIVPESDGNMDIISGEETGLKNLRQGVPLQVKGSPEVVVDLSGVARLRASGPAASVEEYRQARTEAERRLKELTSPFGKMDIKELEYLKERKDELVGKAREAKVQLDTLLQGSSVEYLAEESSKRSSILASILINYPGWKDTRPDYEAFQVKAKEHRRSFEGRIDEVEARRDAAQAALSAANMKKTRAIAQREEVNKQTIASQAKVASLTIDGKSDEQRKNEYDIALLAWEAARTSKEETDKQLAAFGENPADVMDKLNRQLDASSDKAKKALENEKLEEGKLANILSQGTYSALALAEEEVARLEEDVAEEQLRADAIRVIHDMVEQCRAEALDAVIGPVEKRAGGILQRIAGERLGALDLGDTFEPVAVSPGVTEDLVAMEGNLSGGEQEQIYLATRLALAEVLAKEERQLVVFDDVLTATDTARLTRIMTILEEEAQKLQILILTCHPERYGGLSGANFIDLAKLVENSYNL